MLYSREDLFHLSLTIGTEISYFIRLIAAIKSHHKSVVALLLAAGADVTERCGWFLLIKTQGEEALVTLHL